MRRRTLLALALLLAARFAVGAVYSLVVPIWEAYDEPGHFAYVRYLVKYRQLLDPADPEAQVVYEKFQPPLYYLIVAPFLAGFDLGEALPQIERNPYWSYRNSGFNYALHPPGLEGTETQVALAVRVARLVSVAMSTVSVVFVYHTARRVWARPDGRPSGPVWATTLLYAFWPQFLFIGSTINNDVAVTVFSASALLLMVHLITDGFRTWRALALAFLLGAAILSKLNALALLPVALLATAMSMTPLRRHARWRTAKPWLGVLVFIGVMAGALGLVGTMPYVTGQVLRVEVLRQFLSHLFGTPASLGLVLEAMPFTWQGFIALFGWGRMNAPSVVLPAWLYQTWSAGFALAALGLVIGTAQRVRAHQGPNLRLLLLMGLAILSLLAVALALVVAYQISNLAPGRYLLPVLPAVCILLVEGVRAWLPQRIRGHAWKAVGLGAVMLGWSIPLGTLIPAYAIPQPVRGHIDVPLNYAFGESIRLVGYQTPAPARQGQEARVDLCWEATAPLPENYSAVLEIFGPDGKRYGQLITFPGAGNFPTRFWTPGVPFCDRYAVRLDPETPAPMQAWLHASLVSTTFINGYIIEGTRLPVIEPSGQRAELDAFVLPLKIESTQRPARPDQPLDYRFGDGLRLRGYSLAADPATRTVRVTFQWQALRDLTADYQVFVHLRDTPQSAYAQADSEPRAGWYPTHLWRKGEIVEDTYLLSLPEGNAPPLSLYMGVVDPSLEARLPVVNSAKERLENDELILLQDWVLDESWSLPDSLAPP